MKKLYDEIMAIDEPKCIHDAFGYGFRTARFKSAELAKKYDNEISQLKERLAQANKANLTDDWKFY